MGNGSPSNRDSYHKLFKQIKENDKRIASRYDGLRGSDYLITVAAILFDEQITEEEIKDFSDEAKQLIHNWISFWKNNDK